MATPSHQPDPPEAEPEGLYSTQHELSNEDLSELDDELDNLDALFEEALKGPAGHLGEKPAEPEVEGIAPDPEADDGITVDLDNILDDLDLGPPPADRSSAEDEAAEAGVRPFEVESASSSAAAEQGAEAFAAERDRMRGEIDLLKGIRATREAELDAAEERIADLEAQLRQTSMTLTSARAETQRARHRAEQDRNDARLYGAEKALKEFLPVYDNLERALSHAGTDRDSALGQGVNMILAQLLQVLARIGAQPVEAQPGTRFDPNMHEAVGQTPSDEYEAGQIVAQLQRGFKLHERLLRAAMVSVSGGPGPETTPQDEVDGDDEAATQTELKAVADGAPPTADDEAIPPTEPETPPQD